MKLEGKASQHSGMRLTYNYMNEIFGDDAELASYYGPAEMCVFGFQYLYLPKNYSIKIECERGIIQLEIINEEGKVFSPWHIYPEARYYHFEDRAVDVLELIILSHKAILDNEIVFLDTEERRILASSVKFLNK